MVTFWSHLPSSLSSLLYTRPVVSVVAVCDSVLYKAAVKAVLPSPSLPGCLTSHLSRLTASSHHIFIFSPDGDFTRSAIRKFGLEFPQVVKNCSNPQAELLKQVRLKRKLNLNFWQKFGLIISLT